MSEYNLYYDVDTCDYMVEKYHHTDEYYPTEAPYWELCYQHYDEDKCKQWIAEQEIKDNAK